MANIARAIQYAEHWKSAAELKAFYEESKFEPLLINGLPEIFPAGLKRGTITEVFGSRSSGRTALALHILAQATTRGEVCAVVDLFDSFDPLSAAAAKVQLERLVWIRCGGNLQHALRATDLLLHAGGFGVISLDVCEASPRLLQRMPLSYWHRFRKVLENTPTVLLVPADSAQAKSCSFMGLLMKAKAISWLGKGPFNRLAGLEIQAIPSKVRSIRPHSLFLKSAA